MEKISNHISYKEAIKSNTATRLGINNIPNDYQITNMVGVAVNVFEPLRKYVGGPIKINSFFRCEALNRAIGGSSRQQHCEGRAIDLDDTFGHKTNAEMFHYIRENLNFDQLIWEFGNDKNPDWVHVSYVSKEENRGRVLQAEIINGKTTYKIIQQLSNIDLNEKTNVKVDIKTLVGVCLALFSIASVYFTLLAEIQALNVNVMRMESELKMNTEFRIKWPRGEMGALPDDAEQNLRLFYIEKNSDKWTEDINQIKLKIKEIENCIK